MQSFGFGLVGGHHRVQTKLEEKKQWTRWYKTPTWKAIKRHRFSQEPNCRVCVQEGQAVSATHVGHVEPHGGQWLLFFRYENTVSLCARHHAAQRRRR